jgi:alpha-tubulin suppressor-like RCC1 family protein
MPTTRRTAVLLTLLASVAVLVPAPRAEAGGDPRLDGLVQIDIGSSHACARTDDGRVWCWGRDLFGELGDDGTSESAVPVRVRAVAGPGVLGGVTGLSVGGSHTCVVLTNHQARCWGDNSAGQLGNGTADTVENRPVVVQNASGSGPLTGVAQISAGINHTCAVLTDGQARCWGSGTFGQLGTGSDSEVHRPRAVLGLTGPGPLTGVALVAAGSAHTCAVLRNHEARCWGQASDGQIGTTAMIDFAFRPRRVLNRMGTGPLTGVNAISVGDAHTCATLRNRQVRCWGLDTSGQLGNGPGGDRRLPAIVKDVDGVGPLTGASRVASGGDHTCVVVAGRQVRCWGDDQDGDLGDDAPTSPSPLPVITVGLVGDPRLLTVTQIGLSDGHSCARLANGEARCWGTNTHFELGNQFPGPASRPVPVLAPL